MSPAVPPSLAVPAAPAAGPPAAASPALAAGPSASVNRSMVQGRATGPAPSAPLYISTLGRRLIPVETPSDLDQRIRKLADDINAKLQEGKPTSWDTDLEINFTNKIVSYTDQQGKRISVAMGRSDVENKPQYKDIAEDLEAVSRDLHRVFTAIHPRSENELSNRDGVDGSFSSARSGRFKNWLRKKDRPVDWGRLQQALGNNGGSSLNVYSINDRINDMEKDVQKWQSCIESSIAKEDGKTKELKARLKELNRLKKELEEVNWKMVSVAIAFGMKFDCVNHPQNREKCAEAIQDYMRKEMAEYADGEWKRMRQILPGMADPIAADEIEVLALESGDLIFSDRAEVYQRMMGDREKNPEMEGRTFKKSSVEELLVFLALNPSLDSKGKKAAFIDRGFGFGCKTVIHCRDIPGLENFHEEDIRDGANVYPCAEAYFQSRKFAEPSIQQRFTRQELEKYIKQRIAGNPVTAQPKDLFGAAAMDCAQELINAGNSLDSNWISGGGNVRAMEETLQKKFDQNPSLKQKLMATGDAQLIVSSQDSFWGMGTDGQGQNKLGTLLMELRRSYQGSSFSDTLDAIVS